MPKIELKNNFENYVINLLYLDTCLIKIYGINL